MTPVKLNLHFLFILFVSLCGSLQTEMNHNTSFGQPELRGRGIFDSLSSILDFLKQPKYRSSPVVKDMFEQYKKSLYLNQQLTDFLPVARRRFIVIEGLYTSKRNAVAKLVAQKMGAKHIVNQYPQKAGVTSLKSTYGTKQAYYSLIKYGMANLVHTIVKRMALVMERYWLDQATFVIAKNFGQNLPPQNSNLYEWPSDLLKPDVTFFINDDDKSFDDLDLPSDSSNFTESILQVYDQFKKVVPIIEISSDQLPEDMAEEIVAHVRMMGPDIVQPANKSKEETRI